MLYIDTRTHTHPYPHTIQVHYYGLIKQSTGEDWENAKISLSTAQPSVGGSAPKLGIQNIQFKRLARPTHRHKIAEHDIKLVNLGASCKTGAGAKLPSRRSATSYYDESGSDEDGYDENCIEPPFYEIPPPCSAQPPPAPPPPQMKVDVAEVLSNVAFYCRVSGMNR